jgi:hypothetical protein
MNDEEVKRAHKQIYASAGGRAFPSMTDEEYNQLTEDYRKDHMDGQRVERYDKSVSRIETIIGLGALSLVIVPVGIFCLGLWKCYELLF